MLASVGSPGPVAAPLGSRKVQEPVRQDSGLVPIELGAEQLARGWQRQGPIQRAHREEYADALS